MSIRIPDICQVAVLRGGTNLCFLPLLEERFLPFLLLLLLPRKVFLTPNFLHSLAVDPFQIDLQRCSNNISSIYPP